MLDAIENINYGTQVQVRKVSRWEASQAPVWPKASLGSPGSLFELYSKWTAKHGDRQQFSLRLNPNQDSAS